MAERIETVSHSDSGASNAEAIHPEPVSEERSESEISQSEPETLPSAGVAGLPPELIGPDGKLLPLNEATMRMLRGKYFTVRHDTAVCGHAVDRINQPSNNCHVCWWAFCQTHATLVKTAHEFYQQFGKERLVAMRGAKFVKFFLMFMSTVQHLLEQQKLEQEKNGNNLEGRDGDAPSEAREGNQGALEVSDGGREAEVSQVSNDATQQ